MSLERLLDDIRACRICIESPDGAPLPHDPRPVIQASGTARICIVGQAPGNLVNQTGVPFNDPSGDRLREWMGVAGNYSDSLHVALSEYDKGNTDG